MLPTCCDFMFKDCRTAFVWSIDGLNDVGELIDLGLGRDFPGDDILSKSSMSASVIFALIREASTLSDAYGLFVAKPVLWWSLSLKKRLEMLESLSSLRSALDSRADTTLLASRVVEKPCLGDAVSLFTSSSSS